jgi:SAM-dependent methyltransferase
MFGILFRALYRARVGGWTRQLGTSGLVLEIGCGDGSMLDAMRARGWRVIGSERSPEAARDAASRHIPVYVGDIEGTSPTPIFDLIVMFHVLEHLYRPADQLRACAARLRRGGSLLVGVPNSASWQASLFGEHWFHLDVPRHFIHYTPDALERSLSAAGLNLRAIRFASFEHDPFGWVQSAMNAMGLEQDLLLKYITGMPRNTGGVGTILMLLLAVPLTLLGTLAALASWTARAGAVMEVWATKD